MGAPGQIRREDKLCNSVLGTANHLILRHKAIELRCGKHVTPVCDGTEAVVRTSAWRGDPLFYVEQSGELAATPIKLASYCQQCSGYLSPAVACPEALARSSRYHNSNHRDQPLAPRLATVSASRLADPEFGGEPFRARLSCRRRGRTYWLVSALPIRRRAGKANQCST